MPTNKLWIEHTERAAWDSVEALRERLLKAETRLQALAPNVERLPQLLDALELLKQKLAPAASAPDELIGAALSRIDTLESELDASRAAAPRAVNVSLPDPRPRLDSVDLDRDMREENDLGLDDFARAMARQQKGSAVLPRDMDRLLALAETKLDDLTEQEGGALREAALELALIAARIYVDSRARG